MVDVNNVLKMHFSQENVPKRYTIAMTQHVALIWDFGFQSKSEILLNVYSLPCCSSDTLNIPNCSEHQALGSFYFTEPHIIFLMDNHSK